MKMSKCFMALVATLALQVTAAQAANLVVNPDFDTNITTGWTNVIVGFTWDGTDGSPSPGSAHASGTSHAVLDSACMVISGVSIDLSANYKLTTGSSLTVVAYAYTDSNCMTAAAPDYVAFAPATIADSTWHTLSQTNIGLPAGVNSVLLELYADAATGNVDGHVDHILFGPTGTTPVRLQTFDVK